MVDPGLNGKKIAEFVKKSKLKLNGIFLTHFHFDHVASAKEIYENMNVKSYIHKLDVDQVTKNTLSKNYNMGDIILDKESLIPIEEGAIKIGNFNFDVIHAPGHTEGSILIKIGTIVFTGDVIFEKEIGAVTFYGGDSEKMKSSIAMIKKTLKDNFTLYPGHGNQNTFSNIKKINPFLK